jgi:general secretion pathway protein A
VYTRFFGLNEKPFSITPDPRYLYLSQRHADALAHLVYGVSESGGFIQLTGEVGTGKTTLIRSLLEQLPEKAQIALVLNPQLSALEFLHSICQELDVPAIAEGSVKAWIDALNAHLLRAHARGQRVVLIVDEAQQLSIELLEQVRLLTNLETAKTKLLQIILIGQPELREILSRPELRQIAQRITGRYHLEPLSRDDAAAYVSHRMKVAGATAPIFSAPALRQLYRESHGIPRLINVVADRALLAAYARERSTIDRSLVRQAAAEVFGARPLPARAWRWAALIALGTAVIWAAVVAWSWRARPTIAVAAAAREAAMSVPARTPAEPVPAPDALPASPAQQTQASLLDRLAAENFDFTAEAALRNLLAVWKLPYDPAAGSPCEQAARQGLRCLFQNGSLGQLRRANRPAVLTLTDDEGAQYQVVLRSLDEQHAEFVFDTRSVRVGLAELVNHWYGDHLIMWRPGMLADNELVPGSRNPNVRWLRQAMADLDGAAVAEPADALLYDESLAGRVRAYQRRKHLDVDGIVGVQTQLALGADLSHSDEPVLVTEH